MYKLTSNKHKRFSELKCSPAMSVSNNNHDNNQSGNTGKIGQRQWKGSGEEEKKKEEGKKTRH